MTDITTDTSLSASALPGLNKRYRQEKIFRWIGLSAIAFSLGFLAFLLLSIFTKGFGAFFHTEIEVTIEQAWIDEAAGESYDLLRATVRGTFPDASGRTERREASAMFGANAEEPLRTLIANNNSSTGEPIRLWIPASDSVDVAYKSGWVSNPDASPAGVSERQLAWLDTFAAEGRLRQSFNSGFLFNGDSRDAERAGVGGAIMGSIFTLAVCLVLSFVIGIFAAIYLEELAPKNTFTRFLEVNINNLASVPSIIYGLLGLAIFLNFFSFPRSSSLVGGMVLALMTLPTIIIASRVSLKSVPPSIREAALGLGATRIQAVFHHVVPLALPGMLTGTILGMARALGETAPLLMIGMVAFIADPPSSFTDPAASLPVQVYLWSDSPERAFAEKTAGAIIVLIVFLVLMNLTAILLRKKFERRW